jgi:Zn-dependent metalloprotease
MENRCRCVNCIMPPQLLRRLLESSDRDIRQAALSTLLTTERLRGERSVRAMMMGVASAPSAGRRTIYDCATGTNLASATLARSEDGQAASDASVNRAFDGLGATRDFYKAVLGRDSIDDRGMRLDGYVHRGLRYNNAFWDGQEMIFGDGDGTLFTDFTLSLDVIAHELTHGVTDFTAGLEYHNQSGALNESISDVFGSLVKQWRLGQTAETADWLIGAELFTPGVDADALRSMKAPGTAFDDPILGKDPQPPHMSKFVQLPDTEEDDWGGVHTNSGIPNRAFYLTAMAIGGHAWDAPGLIWYEGLKASNTTTQFQEFAETTFAKAGQLYGAASPTQKAVAEAWREVGIKISPLAATAAGIVPPRSDGADTSAALARSLEDLSAEVKRLAKDVSKLKGR